MIITMAPNPNFDYLSLSIRTLTLLILPKLEYQQFAQIKTILGRQISVVFKKIRRIPENNRAKSNKSLWDDVKGNRIVNTNRYRESLFSICVSGRSSGVRPTLETCTHPVLHALLPSICFAFICFLCLSFVLMVLFFAVIGVFLYDRNIECLNKK